MPMSMGFPCLHPVGPTSRRPPGRFARTRSLSDADTANGLARPRPFASCRGLREWGYGSATRTPREISKLGTHLEIPRDGLGALGGGGVAGYVRLNSRGTQVLLG